MASRSADPNFPPNLNIHPLQSLGAPVEDDNQEDSIVKFGIAGRVWEATRPLIRYFSPDQQNGLEPSCPIFDARTPRRIVELGSGQAFASLHLASALQSTDLIVLSDLDNVVPLCETSIENWKQRSEAGANVVARPLAWGGDSSRVRAEGPFDFILMCDLIYFPHLYPPLLYTLLELTEPETKTGICEETFGPTIILSYHSRTLALEESFFDSFGKYFKMEPVVGGDWEAKVYICRRWRITEEWSLPGITKVMEGAPGVVRGRDFGLIDELFASLEW